MSDSDALGADVAGRHVGQKLKTHPLSNSDARVKASLAIVWLIPLE